MRVSWQRNLLARRRHSHLLTRLAGALFSLIYLTVAAVVASGTYAWCNSKAGPSVSTFRAIEGKQVLETYGTFDECSWMEGKGSGLYVINQTDSDLWVYFSISGSLRDLVQPVNPIQLAVGEKAQIPLAVDQHSDLALLAWRNQDAVFKGSITARAYNNFVSREFAGIHISAARLYDAVVGGHQMSAMAYVGETGTDRAQDWSLGDITSVHDLERLLEENSTRGQELERLQEETEHQRGMIAMLEDKINTLLNKISTLIEENSLLGSLVDSLKSQPERPSSSAGSDSGGGGTEPEPPGATEPEPQEPQPADPGELPADDPKEDPADDGPGSQTGNETGDQSGGKQEDPPVGPGGPPEDPPATKLPVDEGSLEDPLATETPVDEEPPAAQEPE